MDSNFQYAEAVKLGCRPFFLRRLLETRRAGRRAAVQLVFSGAASHATEPCYYDTDRLTPRALIAARSRIEFTLLRAFRKRSGAGLGDHLDAALARVGPAGS